MVWGLRWLLFWAKVQAALRFMVWGLFVCARVWGRFGFRAFGVWGVLPFKVQDPRCLCGSCKEKVPEALVRYVTSFPAVFA